MLFWRHEEKPEGPLYDWLLANKEQVLAGTANYMGTPVTESTSARQYSYVVSCGCGTVAVRSSHFLPCAANNHLRFAGLKYAIATLLLGWWALPWGPLLTIHALLSNLSGGRKRTVASLLQFLEWGWDAPDDVSFYEHTKKILEVSEAAAEEIRSRLASGGFSSGVAVRVTPTKWADTEVEISFDYPVSDGRDWIDESRGLTLLIDKKHEPQLRGCVVEFCDGTFNTNSALR